MRFSRTFLNKYIFSISKHLFTSNISTTIIIIVTKLTSSFLIVLNKKKYSVVLLGRELSKLTV